MSSRTDRQRGDAAIVEAVTDIDPQTGSSSLKVNKRQWCRETVDNRRQDREEIEPWDFETVGQSGR